MTFKLDLRVRKSAALGRGVLRDGFPFVCGWCGRRFFTARELTAHVLERRVQTFEEHTAAAIEKILEA